MEYTALYRRFRPMTFSEILGQDHIVTTIRNQVVANRVGHAYLFTGCRGCGKTSSAKVLARAINCLNPINGEPCNECSVCKAALEGSLTDIVEMDAASNNSVDDIRAIRDEVNFLPTVAKYRVYIIDEVHMLSTGAFNALLKTLEEPPAHVKFILATTEPQKLPATILSRCQRFDFKKIPEENIVENLIKICDECKIEYTQGALNLIAELSEGAMRDALSILERCAQDGENKIDEEKIKKLVGIPETRIVLNVVDKIIKKDAEGALNVTQEIIKEGKDVTNLIWEMIKLVRDLMLLKSTSKVSNIYNKDEVNIMNNLVKDVNNERLLKIIYTLSSLENDLKWSSQKNIVFQVGILKLCSEETQGLEERIKIIEDKIASGKFVQSVQSAGVNISNTQRSVSSVNSANATVPKVKPVASNNVIGPQANAKGVPFWGNVINQLREQRQPMLYSNLMNTRGVIIDDMTFGIEFPNGLNSFGRSVIERQENMTELKRLISIECKKDMRIKLIDGKQKIENSNNANNASNIDLGIDINIIN